MLYIFHGKDREKARDKIYHLIRSLRDKKRETSYVHIDSDSDQNIRLYAEEQGLFKQKTIVFLDEPGNKDEIEKNLEVYVKSHNVFFLFEEKIKKSLLKKASDLDVVVEEFVSPQKQEQQTQLFSLADALLKKNDSFAFILFNTAHKEGRGYEEIFGVVSWQLRALLLAKDAHTAQEAGLSPFPFKKAKQHTDTFSKKTLLQALEVSNGAITDTPIQKYPDMFAEKEFLRIVNILHS